MADNEIKTRISADAKQFNAGVNSAEKSARGFTSSIGKWFKSAGSSIASFGANALGVFAAFRGVQAFKSGFSSIIELSGELQKAEVRLKSSFGKSLDSEGISDFARRLRQMSANGTESFDSLVSSAVKLGSVMNWRDALKWVEAFQNISAGTGESMDRVIGEFVKAKASGGISSSLTDMFAKKGVNIYSVIAEQTGEAEAQIKKMAASGALSFSVIEQAILATASAGGVFAGKAREMSETSQGAWETLRAQWNIVCAELAEPIADAVTPWIKRVGEGLAWLARNVKEIAAVIKAAFVGVFGFVFAKITGAVFSIGRAVGGMQNLFTSAFAAIRTAASGLFAFMKANIASIITGLATMATMAYVNSKEKDSDLLEAHSQANTHVQEAMKSLDEANSEDDFAEKEKALKYAIEREQALRQKAQDKGLLGEGGVVYQTKDIVEAARGKFNERIAAQNASAEESAKAEKAEQDEAARKQATQVHAENQKTGFVAAAGGTVKPLTEEEQLTAERSKLLGGSLIAGETDADRLAAMRNEYARLERSSWGDKTFTSEDLSKFEELSATLGRVGEIDARLSEISTAKAKETAETESSRTTKKQELEAMKAEASGDDARAAEIRNAMRERELTEEYSKDFSPEEAASMARERIGYENEIEARNNAASPEAGNNVRVWTAQGDVGGGRSLNLGTDSMLQVAQKQLDVQEKLLKATEAKQESGSDSGSTYS